MPFIIVGFASYTYIGGRHSWDELWNVLCVLVSLSGLAVRVLTVGHVSGGTSGRNTRHQVASDLNTTGLYSVVRHPLYLGNYVMVFGVTMFFHTWWIVALVTCLCILYYERIIFAEESFLRDRFGDRFETWAAITPAIVPNWSLWSSPKLAFSWRTALRREYTGLAIVTIVFPLLEVVGDSIAEKHLRVDWPWLVLALVGGSIYLILRSMKKQTRWLDETGRC